MNLIFAVAGQSPAGMSNMTTLTAFAPPAGRVRFWKAATGFFGLASAGVFADVALGSEGLGTAVFIAAIPAVFAALSALALRSVVSPIRAPKLPKGVLAGLFGTPSRYDHAGLHSFGAHGALNTLDEYEIHDRNWLDRHQEYFEHDQKRRVDHEQHHLQPEIFESVGGTDIYDDGRGSFNPATGLPMMGSFDIEGNAYGSGSIDHEVSNTSDFSSHTTSWAD